ncbi:YkvI family membrane protein [Paenibacillus sp. FA6]|uniref:YkvI family membrane protein n=1 Tax=Paenibacillus sp. FA6 TaxID=3413029 RepID=UPI003F658626
MKNVGRILQIAFTYIGTIVGAGFATGQEILQFFTQYGKWATLTIILSTILFIWLGTKMMIISRTIRAKSYEDLNKYLFGHKSGGYISIIMLFVLIGVNSIMLAGAGSVFVEHLNLHYQTGLIITLVGTYFLLRRGMHSIMYMNSIVVPMMLTISLLIISNTLQMPNADRFITLSTDTNLTMAWLSPVLYTAFNLVMAQAILVPLGSRTESLTVIKWGGIIGGLGVGFMLMAAHFALSAQMPGIMQYEIPMGNIAFQLGVAVQLIYVLLIFLEIFTTFVADIYGVSLQLQQHFHFSPKVISVAIMLACFLVSQLGFSYLLSVLYPLFGFLSMFWVVKLMVARK